MIFDEPGDAPFADLFAERERRPVPPSAVATVIVLQRLERGYRTGTRSTGTPSICAGGMPAGGGEHGGAGWDRTASGEAARVQLRRLGQYPPRGREAAERARHGVQQH